MDLRPPPVWWPRSEPNLLLTSVRSGHGAASTAAARSLETFPNFPLLRLWTLAVRRGLIPGSAGMPRRLRASAAQRWADALEPLIPETCWTADSSDCLDCAAPYLALLRGPHGVAIEPGPDRLSAWLVRVHRRHRPIGAVLRP